MSSHRRAETPASLSVLQVDPSLFTAPYNAALSRGLEANGVKPNWATRALRPKEEDLLNGFAVHPFFYPLTDGPARRTGRVWRALKGVEHAAGLRQLRRAAQGADVVHFQWAAVPMLDARAAQAIGRERPVIMTVHDIKPFNGRPVSALQRRGYDGMLATADRLVVHTDEGRDALVARGFDPGRVRVVPHGLLPLRAVAPEPRGEDGRWRVVLFGRQQPYKGADLLVEALGRLDAATRARLEVIVAGEPQMDIAPMLARAEALGLGSAFAMRPHRLAEDEMAALLRSADAFVFPYRTIDASGVLHLVAELGRWLIASDLGAFRAMLEGAPGAGELVPAADVDALAAALARSIGRRPDAAPATGHTDWTEIGAMTRALYEEALAERRRGAVQ